MLTTPQRDRRYLMLYMGYYWLMLGAQIQTQMTGMEGCALFSNSMLCEVSRLILGMNSRFGGEFPNPRTASTGCSISVR